MLSTYRKHSKYYSLNHGNDASFFSVLVKRSVKSKIIWTSKLGIFRNDYRRIVPELYRFLAVGNFRTKVKDVRQGVMFPIANEYFLRYSEFGNELIEVVFFTNNSPYVSPPITKLNKISINILVVANLFNLKNKTAIVTAFLQTFVQPPEVWSCRLNHCKFFVNLKKNITCIQSLIDNFRIEYLILQ
jgi:hypothetical protein